ncbi:MAG: hypothetical protein M1828_007119 [Chrysothrix sp. TS-e1954]|nr:MAG: hypothetical protein M1828_007119 [Chrysothrix sp. TS-e1954]
MRLLKHTGNRRKPPSPTSYPIQSITPPKSPLLVTIHNKEIGSEDGDTMSADSVSSRPQSATTVSRTVRSKVCYVRRPTLREILRDEGSPPWTLEAFAAYCEQNHCSENLEFIQDAERYRVAYRATSRRHSGLEEPEQSLRPMLSRWTSGEFEDIKEMWTRLILLYIAPSSPRELNLPGNIRNDLVAIDRGAEPTSPEHLQHAVNKTYELIEDSILFTFLNDVRPPDAVDTDSESIDDSRTSRDRLSSTKIRELPTSEPSVTFSPTRRPQKTGPSHFHQTSRPSSHLSTKTSQSSNPGDEIGGLRGQAHLGSYNTGSPSASSPGLLSPNASTHHLSTPPGSPGPADELARPGSRRKNDAPWKRMSMRFGFKKKGLKDLPESEGTMPDEGRP